MVRSSLRRTKSQKKIHPSTQNKTAHPERFFVVCRRTKLNYYYLTENGEIATCTVYEVMDVYSECLLGFHISKSEDFEAQYYAFKSNVLQRLQALRNQVRQSRRTQKLQAGQFFKNLAKLAINTSV